MAAGMLSKPGTQYGPCEKMFPGDPFCKHIDCQKTREMANTICTICLKPIGYETRFYEQDDKNLVHALCLESDGWVVVHCSSTSCLGKHNGGLGFKVTVKKGHEQGALCNECYCR